MLKKLAGEGFRMGILSIVSFVLGYLLTFILHEGMRIAVEGAYTLAILICSVLNFFGCRHYVFQGTKGTILLEAAKFFPSILVFRAVEVVLFSQLNRISDNYHLAYVATALISMVCKFVASRFIIFKRSP
ncbi:hypothetical protein GCM10011394_23270 [Luteimonas terricola]|uniref:GtrA/DPMS transmembrane domain-containing protein n=2 Tax=Luteimonas terricola TaxID=645597 RepID=A0ABQ2EL58_9GAMM|nr:hypothetical protein GCM10011394_23270 [Luteimonas terricola]